MVPVTTPPPAICGGDGCGGATFGPRFRPSSFLIYRHKNVVRITENNGILECCSIPRLAFQFDVDALPSLSIRGNNSHPNFKVSSLFSRGMTIWHASASSSVFLSGNQGSLCGLVPILPSKRGSSMRAQARKSTSSGPSFPALTEKPDWWWRFLSTVPYLISLQISDAGFYIQPFLEHHEKFEDLIYYIPGAIKRWSIWFPMLYCYLAYLGGVKNKKWPHFFRYHLIMAMLLENVLQVVWVSSNFAPLIHFNGNFGIYYWAAVGLLYIFIILEGIRSALGGKYYKIPFVSETALIHTLYHVGGFHKPF